MNACFPLVNTVNMIKEETFFSTVTWRRRRGSSPGAAGLWNSRHQHVGVVPVEADRGRRRDIISGRRFREVAGRSSGQATGSSSSAPCRPLSRTSTKATNLAVLAGHHQVWTSPCLGRPQARAREEADPLASPSLWGAPGRME
jgi:hypothetical protein